MRPNQSSRKNPKRNRRNVRNQRQRNRSLVSNSSTDFSNFLNYIEIGLRNNEEWALNLFADNQARHSSRNMTRHSRWCRCRNRAHLAHSSRNRSNTRRHNVRRQREQRQQQCRHHARRPTANSSSRLVHANIRDNAMTESEVEIFRELMELENLEREAEIETTFLQSLSSDESIIEISSSSSIDSVKEVDNSISETSSLTLISNNEVESSEEDVAMILEMRSPIREFRNETQGPNIMNVQLRGEQQVEILEEVAEFRNVTANLLDTLNLENAADNITDDVIASGDGFHNDPYFQIEFLVTENDLREAAAVVMAGRPDDILEEIDNENDNENSESDLHINDNDEN